MNKIEELIQQLCPEGVEFKELGKVISALRTGLNPRQNFKLNPPDAKHYYITVRELNGFSIQVTEKTDRVDSVGLTLIQNRSKIQLGDILFSGTGTIGRTALVTDTPNNWNIKEGIYVITPIVNLINARFLIYLVQSCQIYHQILAKADGSTVTSISMASLRKISIPVPPLPIQQEIVSILDKFTQLEAELEAELEARRAQYAYYRAKLLNFNNKRGVGYNWLTLRELCLKTDNMKWKENDNIDFKYIDLSSVDRMSNKITETQIITSQNAPSRAQQIVRNNDVIFGTTRPTLKRYCIITPEYDGQICSTGFCVLRANTEMILPKYLFFVLTTSDFYNYVEYNQEGAGYPAISNNKVKEYKMAVPSIEEQNRIVEVLDKFDSLVNDISIGLPAEIEARRKQYEYYRGKLLSFKVVSD